MGGMGVTPPAPGACSFCNLAKNGVSHTVWWDERYPVFRPLTCIYINGHSPPWMISGEKTGLAGHEVHEHYFFSRFDSVGGMGAALGGAEFRGAEFLCRSRAGVLGRCGGRGPAG